MKKPPRLEELVTRTRRVLRDTCADEQEPLGSALAERILADRRTAPGESGSWMTVERCSLIGAACAVVMAVVSTVVVGQQEGKPIEDLWMEYSEESP